MRGTQLLRNMWARHTAPGRTVTELYSNLVRKGVIYENADQRAMAEACTPLLELIRSPKLAAVCTTSSSPADSASSPKFSGLTTWLRLLFDRLLPIEDRTARTVGFLHANTLGVGEAKRGLYIWGDVGIGKTMVLDLFEICDTAPFNKRRAHIHSFMTDIATRLVCAGKQLEIERVALAKKVGLLRAKQDPLYSVQPMDLVIESVLAESPILCFDEFQTFDVAHAALLASFFSGAFQRGLFLITTSNRAPEDLCRISSSFSSFLSCLHAHCEVFHSSIDIDYRDRPAAEHCHSNVFVYPNSTSAARRLVQLIYAAPQAGLASSDFQMLARTFHTVIVTNVPHIATCDRNAVHQFVVLVDELYQHNVKLLLTTQVPWDKLLDNEELSTTFAREGNFDDPNRYYSEGEDDRSGHTAYYTFRNTEEVISFGRIRSRLGEMGSSSYLLRDHVSFSVTDFDFSVLIVNADTFERSKLNTDDVLEGV